MTAYVISEVHAVDDAKFQSYRRLAAASIAAHGGRYLARGAEAFVAEGSAATGRFVVVEFPSMERLQAWYASPAYAEALAFHEGGFERRLIFLDGVVT